MSRRTTRQRHWYQLLRDKKLKEKSTPQSEYQI